MIKPFPKLYVYLPRTSPRQRLPERKHMTIAAGFLCNDGLVLCADTRETIPGYVKSDTEKMVMLKFPLYNLAITGAGDSDLIEMLGEEIADALLLEKTNAAIMPILSVLKKTLIRVFNDHVASYPVSQYDERPTATLLIGLQVHSATLLYKSRGTLLRRLRTAECVGTGLALGKSLIDRLHTPTMSLSHAGLIALYTLRQAKRWVDGCGGNSDILLLSNRECKTTRIPTDQIKELEAHFDEFDKAIRPVLISCADGAMEHTAFDQVMKAFQLEMLKLRGKFMEFEEFTQRLCELSGVPYRKPSVEEINNTIKQMMTLGAA
jgi:20S proteasome alpha/beta subunit